MFTREFFVELREKYFNPRKCPPGMFPGRRDCCLHFVRHISEPAEAICAYCWIHKHHNKYEEERGV